MAVGDRTPSPSPAEPFPAALVWRPAPALALTSHIRPLFLHRLAGFPGSSYSRLYRASAWLPDDRTAPLPRPPCHYAPLKFPLRSATKVNGHIQRRLVV